MSFNPKPIDSELLHFMGILSWYGTSQMSVCVTMVVIDEGRVPDKVLWPDDLWEKIAQGIYQVKDLAIVTPKTLMDGPICVDISERDIT